MFDIDQAVRAAKTNVDLFVSVQYMELRLNLARDFAQLRADADARFDALEKEFEEKYSGDQDDRTE